MAEELREGDFLYDLWNKGEVGHRSKILQIILVKAGLLKEGFYNGGFVNLRKCTRDEGFVHNCVGKIVLRHSSRREEGMGSSSQVLGADLFKISWTFFSETGVKDWSGRPLKGWPKGCEALGWELPVKAEFTLPGCWFYHFIRSMKIKINKGFWKFLKSPWILPPQIHMNPVCGMATIYIYICLSLVCMWHITVAVSPVVKYSAYHEHDTDFHSSLCLFHVWQTWQGQYHYPVERSAHHQHSDHGAPAEDHPTLQGEAAHEWHQQWWLSPANSAATIQLSVWWSGDSSYCCHCWNSFLWWWTLWWKTTLMRDHACCMTTFFLKFSVHVSM